MAIPKIYLKKKKNEADSQLYLYYSYNRERLEYYTGFRIQEKYYNNLYFKSTTKKPVKSSYPYAIQINDVLAEMCAFCVDEVLRDKAIPKDRLSELLDIRFKNKIIQEERAEQKVYDLVSYMQLIKDERDKGIRVIIKGKRKGQPYKKDSLKNLDTTIYNLKKFRESRKIKEIPFDEVDMSFYNSFRNYCINENGMRLSTFATRIRDIKATMNEANEYGETIEKGHLSTRFIKPNYEADTVAVDSESIEKLFLHNFSGRHERIKDLFLTGCYSALRFGDYTTHTILGIDDRMLRLKQNKTEERVTIPIMKRLKSIIKKYNGFPPPVSLQEFNREIKEIFKSKALGIDKMVTIKIDGVEQDVLLSSQISSHTGRRSYATNMFKAGVPVLLIMSATGHKTEESFLKYIRATNEDKAKLLAEWMDKLNI